MVKQLMAAVTLLLIYDTLEAIQYAGAIFDFTMLVKYISYDNKILRYIKYALYRLEKIIIAFEYSWLIDVKLCQLTFKY